MLILLVRGPVSLQNALNPAVKTNKQKNILRRGLAMLARLALNSQSFCLSLGDYSFTLQHLAAVKIIHLIKHGSFFTIVRVNKKKPP
jgi:hypothetical protein